MREPEQRGHMYGVVANFKDVPPHHAFSLNETFLLFLMPCVVPCLTESG